MFTEEILDGFDKFLVKKNLTFSGVVIGGGALLLLKVVSRATQDLDVLDPDINPNIKKASEDFAAEFNKNNSEKILLIDWLNNGPVSLKRELPEGWRESLDLIYRGDAIKLFTLSRDNLLKSKLFAYVDRDVDLRDLIKMSPNKDEVENSYEWVSQRDGHPGWPKHARGKFDDLILILEKERKDK